MAATQIVQKLLVTNESVFGTDQAGSLVSFRPVPFMESTASRSPTRVDNFYDDHLGTLGHIPRRLEDAELTELETWLARYRH